MERRRSRGHEFSLVCFLFIITGKIEPEEESEDVEERCCTKERERGGRGREGKGGNKKHTFPKHIDLGCSSSERTLVVPCSLIFTWRVFGMP